MFWSKKGDLSPFGVPLGELLRMLQPTYIKASLEGSTLVARHGYYTTRTEVVPPRSHESENGPVRAVVRMTTELPRQVAQLFKEPEARVAWNAFAALGAVYVGSRLTIYA